MIEILSKMKTSYILLLCAIMIQAVFSDQCENNLFRLAQQPPDSLASIK